MEEEEVDKPENAFTLTADEDNTRITIGASEATAMIEETFDSIVSFIIATLFYGKVAIEYASISVEKWNAMVNISISVTTIAVRVNHDNHHHIAID